MSIGYNLAKMTVGSAPGTGALALSAAASGFLTFAQAGVLDGDVVTYAIVDGSNCEIGYGTYTSSGMSLSRDTVLRSSGAGNTGKITATAQAVVYITEAAEDLAGIMPPKGRANFLLNLIYQSKAYGAARRLLGLVADGFNATDGVNLTLSSSIATAAGYIGSLLGNANALSMAANAALTRTPGTFTSKQKCSFSFFIKRSTLATNQVLFAGGNNTGNDDFNIQFTTGNAIIINDLASSAYSMQITSAATIADTTSFHHILIAIDTTQATAALRVRCYIDGVETTFTGTFIPQNTNLAWGLYLTTYYIGRLNFSAVSYLSAIIDEINFVDGQQLTPSAFASGNLPVPYTGTYGAQGFQLRFENTGVLGNDTSGNGNAWTNSAGTTTTTAPTASANITLVTNYQTADATVAKARAVIEYNPLVAMTLNTDLTVDLTCNGGVNWTAANLTSLGLGQGGRIVAETDEVICTAGTSFASRVKSFNSKNVQIHGVAVTTR